MAHPDQPRVPPGTPAGGRWAADSRERSSVVLHKDEQTGDLVVDMGEALDDDAYNLTGDYSHPPIPRNAEQVVKFWLTTPIPGHVLDKVAAAFNQRSANLKNAAQANPPERGFLRSKREANAQVAQMATRFDDEIPNYLLADVVRMGCMYRQSVDLTQDESERLVNARFTTNSGTDQFTPSHAWRRYGLDEIEWAFLDTREADLEAKRDLQMWNLHADGVSIRNKMVPDGMQKGADWVPFDGVTD